MLTPDQITQYVKRIRHSQMALVTADDEICAAADAMLAASRIMPICIRL